MTGAPTTDLTTRMGSSLTYEQSRAAWSAAFDRLDEEISCPSRETDGRLAVAKRWVAGDLSGAIRSLGHFAS